MAHKNKSTPQEKEKEKTNNYWRKYLSPEQFHVLREKGTEEPYTGALLHESRAGSFFCAACGKKVFDASTKFESHSGWPSFYDAKPGTVDFHEDKSGGMIRTEVTCHNCGGHLGHIFPDAPEQPTGQRYCINSLALNFEAKGAKQQI